jgi:hypothetical protein
MYHETARYVHWSVRFVVVFDAKESLQFSLEASVTVELPWRLVHNSLASLR